MIDKRALIALLLALSACSKPPAEEAIRANVDAVQTAVEQKDSSDVLQFVKSDFIGNGYLDKQELRRLLIGQFLQHNNIRVVVTNLDVKHNPQFPLSAQMSGVVALTGAENILPNDGRLLAINGSWRLVDDDWQLETLDWE